MDVTYQDLADPRWRHAADVALAAWNESLTRAMAARVVLRPWRSPDGASVPYLIRCEATQADGSPAFRLTAAVLGDQLVNARGAAVATAFLAAAGFPAQRISLGHLLDILYLTSAVAAGWFQPPSVAGWDRAIEPDRMIQMGPSLDYTATGAVLHLYRGVAHEIAAPAAPPGGSRAGSGGPPPGSGPPIGPPGGPPPGSGPPIGPPGGPPAGGWSPPDVERLDVTFDARAAFTTMLLRRNPERTSWHAVH